jgi:hypothetical protein
MTRIAGVGFVDPVPRLISQMTAPPSCAGLGSQCRSLEITLRVVVISGGLGSTDHEATWLLGHTDG